MNKHGSMNRAYNLIWNEALGVWAVVSEIARSRTKGGRKAIKRLSATIAGASLLFAVHAWGDPLAADVLPTGGEVEAGDVTIDQDDSQMDIIQSSDKAVINWDTFSIGSGAAVTFHQNGEDSVALNRVLGGDVSAIYGQLNANGQVFLLNPNGVLFSAGSRVNVGGLVASTMDLANDDFLAGNYHFTANGGAGGVLNRGELNAAGGYVALLSTTVENEGIIRANMGTVVMAAGEAITLNLNGNRLVSYQVDPSTVKSLVANRHLIQADGGQVIMTASASQRLIEQAVPSSEQSAGQIVEEDGVFRLVEVGGTVTADVINIDGGGNGEVRVSGTLDASSRDAQGGQIQVTGKHVGLMAGAQLDASGHSGGGEVLVGGDFQGNNADVLNATRTYVDEDAHINADAGETGDGGRVIVWADETTRFNGEISARGGEQSGNGGFAEVSGKAHLSYNGFTDLRAPEGEQGTLLLDPYNITIQSTGSDTTMTGSTPFESSGDDSILTVATLQAALDAGNVLIQTGAGGSQAGNITVANSVGWFSASSLTLDAHDSIALSDNVDISTFDGNLVMDAGLGSITQGLGSRLRIGGATTVTAGTDITLGSGTNQFFGNVTATAGSGGITLANSRDLLLGNISATSGAVALSTAAGSNASVIANGSFTAASLSVSADGSGDITIADINNALTVTSASFGGNLVLGDSLTGALTLDSASGNVVAGTGDGTVAITGGSVNVLDDMATIGGNLTLTSMAGNITGTNITTMATENTGATSGSITLNSSADVSVGNLTTTGANNNAGVGSNAAQVAVTAGGAINVGAITTTGGTATAGADPNRNGGNAGNITLDAGTTITLSGDLAAIGGLPQGASTQGLGGFVVVKDPTVLGGDRLVTTGDTTGSIVFESSIDSDGTDRSLTLTAGTGSASIEGAVGDSSSLTGLLITALPAATLGGSVTTSTSAGVNVTADTINLGGASASTINTSVGNGIATFTGAATIDGDITFTRGTGAVTFTSTLDSNSTDSDLVFGGGTGAGNVIFSGAVGGTGRLGNIRLDGVTNLTASGGITAGSLVYADAVGDAVAGTGTAFFAGAQNYSQADGVQVFTSGRITQTNSLTTTAAGAAVSLRSTGDILSLDNGSSNITTTNGDVTVQTVGVTQVADSLINAGSGQILVDGEGGTIYMNGRLSTTFDSGLGEDAVLIRDASAITLPGITAANGTVRVGELVGGIADVTGNITQTGSYGGNSNWGIIADTFEADVGGTINLHRTQNVIDYLGDVSLGGALTVRASGSTTGMAILSASLEATSVDIRTGNGALVIGDRNITATSGNITLAGRGLTQSAGSVIDAGAGTILINGSDVNSNTRGDIVMAGTVTTTNTTSNAVRFHQIDALTVGEITTGAGGWVQLGITPEGHHRINGAISQTTGTNIETGTLRVYAASTIDLSNANEFDSLNVIQRGGNVVINDASGGLTFNSAINNGPSVANDISITTAGGALAMGAYGIQGNNITLEGDGVTGSGHIRGSVASGNQVTLNGNIGAIATGQITTNELTGSTDSTATFTNTLNDIRNLGDFTTNGDFTLRENSSTTTQTLSVTGAVNSGTGAVTITTPNQALNLAATGSITGTGVNLIAQLTGAAITLAGDINSNAGDTSLSSQGVITQTAGSISTTGTLTGDAVNAVTLSQTSNAISQLGSFVVSDSGIFLLNDSGGLTLTDNISTNSGAITIATADAALSLGANNITAGGAISGNISLTGRGVTQAAGSTVSAETQTVVIDGHDGVAGGAIDLAGTLITTGNSSTTVTVKGATTAALGTITVGSGTAIIGNGDISGAVTQNDTTLVSAATLAVNTNGAVALDKANTLSSLGTITTGGDFQFNDANGGLTLTDTISSGGGVNITTAGGVLALGSENITASGEISLHGIGISQAAASTVDATAGDIYLNASDAAFTLTGALTSTSATDQAIQIFNGTTVALGNITALNGQVTLGGVTTDNLSGAVTQTGIISASTLAGNIGSSVTLSNNNQVDTLADFASNSNFTFKDTSGGLNLSGTVTTGGTTNIEATGGVLALGDALLDATGHQLTLTGVGISQAALGQVLAANTTAISGIGDIDLSSVTNDFTGTVLLNSTGTSTSVRDANNLTLGTLGLLGLDTSITAIAGGTFELTSEAIATQAGAIDLRSLGGNLRTSGNITTDSGNISLYSSATLNLFDPITSTSGNISLTGASVSHASGGLAVTTGSTGTLSVEATGGNFTMASDFVYQTDTGTISIISAGNVGLADVVTNGTLFVTADGAVTQVAGSLQAGALEVVTQADAGADITLTNTGNLVSSINLQTLNAAADTVVGGAVEYRDAGGFDVAGISTTDTVTLTGGGAVTQSGAINASELTGLTLNNTGAGITLDHADNSVASIDLRARNAANSATADGAISYRGIAGFDVASLLSLGNVELQSGDSVTQTGAINASGLGLSGNGSYTLTNADNSVATLAADIVGNLTFTNNGSLNVGAVTISGIATAGGEVAITATSFDAAGFDINTAGAAGTAGGDITLTTTNALNVGSLSVNGTAAAGASGANGGDSGTVRLTSSSGDITIAGMVTALGGAGDGAGVQGAQGLVRLSAGAGGITAAAIQAGQLGLLSLNQATLTHVNNAIDTLAAQVTGAGQSFSFTNSQDLIVGTVDSGGMPLSGLTTNNGNVSVNTATGNLAISQAVATGGGSFTSLGVDFTSSGVGTLATGGGLLNLNGYTGAVDLGATVTTLGGAITATGAATFDASSITLDTRGANNVAGGNISVATSGALTVADITTMGGADVSDTAGARGGNVTFNSGGSLAVGTITTTGSDAQTSATNAGGQGGAVTLSGVSGIALGSDINAVAGAGAGVVPGGAVTFNSAVTLSGTRTVSGGNISFNDALALDAGLSLNTNDGDLAFAGAVSGTGGLTAALGSGVVTGLNQLQTSVGNLEVTSSSQLTVSDVDITGSQTYNAATAVSGSFGGNGLSFNDIVTLAANTNFDARTFTLMMQDGVVGGAFDLTLTADKMDWAGALATTGAVLIQTTSAGRDVTLGGIADAGAVLDITEAELGFLPGGASSLTIGRSDATGDLNIASLVSVTSPVTLRAGNMAQTAALEAGDLTLLSNGGAINLSHADNQFGSVAISGTPTAVTLANNAAITQNGAWSLAGIAVDLTAAGQDVTLTEVANQFGSLALSGNNANVVVANNLDLSGVSLSGLLNATVDTGSITISDTFATGGNTTLAVNSTIAINEAFTVGGNLSLTSGGLISQGVNGNFDVAGTTNIDTTAFNAGDVFFTNSGATVLGTTLTGGDFTLTSDGQITQSSGGTLRVAGEFITPGAGSIVLSGTAENLFGTFSGGGGASVINAVGVITLEMESGQLQARNSAGTLFATAIDAAGDVVVVSQSGGLIFDGPVVAGTAINLNNAGNNFGGEVTINTDGPNAVDSGASVETGIYQNGAITVGGQAWFTAENNSVVDSGTVVLSELANAFSSLKLSGTDVTVAQAGDMVIGGASTTSLALTAGGTLSQTGALVADDLSVDAGGSIALGHSGNEISTLSLFTATAGDLLFTNAGTDLLIDTAIATTDGNITLQTQGDLTIGVGNTITTTGAASNIVLSASGNFVNQAGSNALAVDANAFWQIWSSSPLLDTLDGLLFDYKQYNTTYGETTVLGTGNGVHYTLAPTVTASLTGSVSRVYDAGTAATLTSSNYQVTGAIDGDTVVLNNPTTGIFDNKNVGTTKQVSVTGIEVASGSNGASAVYGYQVDSSSASAAIGEITVATIAAVTDISAADRAYDGTDTATLTTGSANFTGLLGADVLSVSSASGVFSAGANAGTGLNVAITGITLGGADAGNYTLADSTASTTATINPYVVDLTGSRSYDGSITAAAAALTTGALIGTEMLTLSGTGSVSDRHVGTGKTLTLGDLTLGNGSGGLASNYTLTGGTYTMDITQAALTVTSIDVTRAYDGSLSATGTAIATGGTQLFGADSLAGGSYAFTNANAGTNKTVTTSGVTVSDGNGGANYAVTYADNTSSTIEQAALTVSTSDVTKTYSGGLTATGSAIVTGGTLYTNVSNAGALDSLSGGSFAFTDKNVGDGTKTVTVTGVTVTDGNGGDNYNISYEDNTSSTINPATLTASIVGTPSRVYDGGTSVTVGDANFALSGFMSGEGATVADTVGNFNSADVTGANTVTASLAAGDFTATVGTLLSNYNLPISATGAGEITPLAVNLTGDRVYDGTDTVAAAIFDIGPLIGSETLLLAGNGSVASKNVTETPQTVILGSLTLANGSNGGLASNYTLTGGDHTASFSQASITVAGLVALDKVYDGTTTANLSTSGAIPAGVIGDDDIALTAAIGVFDDSNVGNDIGVTATGMTLTGADQANYQLTPVSGLTANITPRSLAITATGDDKVYDGTTDATVALTDDRIAGDALSLSYSSASFLDKNVGNGKFINVADIVLTGVGAGNYLVETTANAFASITPASLMITTSDITRTYDGLVSAMGTALVTDGTQLFGADSLSGGSYAFADANAGTGKTVTTSGVTVSDGNGGGNYDVTYVDNTNSTIEQAALTVSTSDVTRTYDGSLSAVGTAVATDGTQLFGSDSLSGGSYAFTNANAGTGKTVTASGVTVSDGNGGGNYDVTYVDNTNSTITPAVLTADIIGTPTRAYNEERNVTLSSANFDLSGFVSGENATVIQTVGQFNSSSATEADTVTASLGGEHFVADSGTLLSNYDLPLSASGAGIITVSDTDLGPNPNPNPDPVPDPDTDIGDVTVPDGGNLITSLDGTDAYDPATYWSVAEDKIRGRNRASFRYIGSGNSLSSGNASRPTTLALLAESGGPVRLSANSIVRLSAVNVPSHSQWINHIKPSGTVTSRSAQAGDGSGAGAGVTGRFASVRTFSATVVVQGTQWALQLPIDTFLHKDKNTSIKVTANGTNGKSLPKWLQFDPSKLSFSGTVPLDQGNFAIVINASDSSAGKAFTTIQLRFR